MLMLFCEIYRDYHALTYNNFRPCRAIRKEYSTLACFFKKSPVCGTIALKHWEKKADLHAFLLALSC